MSREKRIFMVGTVINLKQIKFDDSVSPLFKGDELELSSKNFIFAKMVRVNQH